MNAPTSVILTMRDGSKSEQVFPTRFQAELFVFYIPYMSATQADGDDIASAIVSPLVVVGKAEAWPG